MYRGVGGFNPKKGVRGLFSAHWEARLARIWERDPFSTGPQPTFPTAKQEIASAAPWQGGARSPARVVRMREDSSLEAAAGGAHPRRAWPPGGASSPVPLKDPPNPSPGPTPCVPPARGRRESGAAAVVAAPARTWAGRRWGGEEGKTPPGPPCPLAPGRERREQDIPCPGTREGREREGSGAKQLP